MTGLRDILAAFEENLVLARELGARSVELDRALLLPLDRTPPASPPAPVSAPVPVQEKTVSVTTPPSVSVPATPAPSETRMPAEDVKNEKTLVLFVGKKMEGEAAVLFANMIAAMGCAEGEIRFTEIPEVPSKESAEELSRRVDAASPEAIVFLGREAMQTQALAGGTARRGAWGVFRGVQSIATYHPGFILRFWAKDPQGLHHAKGETWIALKETLAHIGRTPPKRERQV